MKNLYLNILALSICAFSANAQLTLTKAGYEPVIGDLDKRINYDSTTAVPKNSGAGQVWNFTSLTTGTASGTYTTSYINPSSAPGATMFPGATIANTEIGGTDYEFYKSSGSIYEFMGDNRLSGPETMVFSNPGTMRSWPISYASSSVDSWAALQTSPSGTMGFAGTVTVSATGSGTVILPNGNVHNNCLQVVETITMTVTSGTFVMTGNIKNTFYYSSLSKFPILEMYYEAMGSLKFGVSANTDALLAGVNENVISSQAATIYPNPTNSELFISLNNKVAPVSLQVMDLQGRVVLDVEYSNSINVASLEQGLYVLKLNYKDKTTFERFVKTN